MMSIQDYWRYLIQTAFCNNNFDMQFINLRLDYISAINFFK